MSNDKDTIKLAAKSAHTLAASLLKKTDGEKSNAGSTSNYTNMKDNDVLISGTIRAFDNDHWRDYKITVTADGEISAEQAKSKASAKPQKNYPIKEFRIKPFSKIAPSRVVNAPGVFNLNIDNETKYSPGDLLATQTAAESEKWINTLKYARCLKLQTLQHPHPLNETSSVSSCRLCDVKNRQASTDVAGMQCLFCPEKQHEICNSCFNLMKNLRDDMLIISPNHTQHQLMAFSKASEIHPYDPAQKVTCSQCNKISEDTIYYCPICDHVECSDCAVPAKKKSNADLTNDSMRLEPQFMKQYFTNNDANHFKLSVKESQRTSSDLAIKSNQAWDVSTIDLAPVPTAYFEVTFNTLKDTELVSVGVANQIFVQNKLLGDQQNSYGFFNNGKASMNSINDAEDGYAKFGNGDTIGVGMLYDSFNQRKLFLTKNGQTIKTFSKSVHRGMDCFPAVSFTRKSDVEFSVNFAGPFKFDLASIPDYRSDRSCRLGELPQEIIAKCFSHAVKTPAQVSEWRTISKVIGQAVVENTVWKALYMMVYPHQNPDLKIKNWRNFFKNRFQAWKERANTYAENSQIENCEFEFECPMLWNNLSPGLAPEQKFCNKCQKTVYQDPDLTQFFCKVYSEDSLHEVISMGRCVALFKLSELEIDDRGLRPRMGSVRQLPPKKIPLPFASSTTNSSTPALDDDLYE